MGGENSRSIDGVRIWFDGQKIWILAVTGTKRFPRMRGNFPANDPGQGSRENAPARPLAQASWTKLNLLAVSPRPAGF